MLLFVLFRDMYGLKLRYAIPYINYFLVVDWIPRLDAMLVVYCHIRFFSSHS